MNADLIARYVACVKAPTPEFLAVKKRWKGFKHQVRINGKWRIEGFQTWLIMCYEKLRSVDPSLPPTPLPDLLTPEVIAKMFGIPPEELGCRNVTGKRGNPGRPSTTKDLAKFACDRRPHVRWKEIAAEYKLLHPQDDRNVDEVKIREAYRRAYIRNRGR
jgi:hypothetical protein